MISAALALLFGLLAIVLGVLLLAQIRQRKALRNWLMAPTQGEIPDGTGAWREVFSQLQRLRKEEKKAYSALSNAHERFRMAAQALPDGVILLDNEQHIEWMNGAVCQHFSLDVSRDLGTQVGQLIRQSEFHKLLATDFGAKGSGPVLLRTNLEGVEQVLSVQLIPFAETGNLLLSRNVTELARTEAMRRDFVANVSHELRTPLTVISGFLELFQSDPAPEGEAAAGFYRLMTEQAERMNRLVVDLLTLSRIENDTRLPPDEVVDMGDMLDLLRREAESLSDGKHRIAIARRSAGNLRGCRDELRSAFGNLVSNAVRYTPAGGTITLNWWIGEEGHPTFSVTDTGIGIPPEHIPRLTERFYRVDKGRSTATGGTGLGLAIVKHVLVRHQGNLHIQSTMGQGSTFSARLPGKRLIVPESLPVQLPEQETTAG